MQSFFHVKSSFVYYLGIRLRISIICCGSLLTISYCGIIIFQSRSIWVLLWFIIFGILHSLTTQNEMQLIESGKGNLYRADFVKHVFCEAVNDLTYNCFFIFKKDTSFLCLKQREQSESNQPTKGLCNPKIQWDRDRKWTGEEESLSVYTASQACMCPKLLHVTFFLSRQRWFFFGSFLVVSLTFTSCCVILELNSDTETSLLNSVIDQGLIPLFPASSVGE